MVRAAQGEGGGLVSGAHLGERLAVLRRAAGLTQESLAEQSGVSPDVIRKLEQRRKDGARLSTLRALAGGLGVDVAALVSDMPLPTGPMPSSGGLDDETAALELRLRAEASDMGDGVLDGLETAADDLATAYPGTAPGDLLVRVRAHLGYVGQLMDTRATLTQRRRLMTTGGWLSLLAATCLIDLHEEGPAAAHLRTAKQLAGEANQAEIAAWCLETQAWQVLTAGDYRRAAEISQAAQHAAPRDSSAFIQATAQEGRAWARLGAAAESRAALARVERLVSPLAVPDRPEHHYRYDPAKSDAYTATTLSWLGDPAAEPYARQVLARLESVSNGPPRPRRAASARLDLSLALIATDRHDEAAEVALDAILSGRIVPSNYWRAREVIHAVAERGVPEASDLNEAYLELSAGSESRR
jgi:transcriptional regulator with XRE-family HTH domain